MRAQQHVGPRPVPAPGQSARGASDAARSSPARAIQTGLVPRSRSPFERTAKVHVRRRRPSRPALLRRRTNRPDPLVWPPPATANLSPPDVMRASRMRSSATCTLPSEPREGPVAQREFTRLRDSSTSTPRVRTTDALQYMIPQTPERRRRIEAQGARAGAPPSAMPPAIIATPLGLAIPIDTSRSVTVRDHSARARARRQQRALDHDGSTSTRPFWLA